MIRGELGNSTGLARSRAKYFWPWAWGSELAYATKPQTVFFFLLPEALCCVHLQRTRSVWILHVSRTHTQCTRTRARAEALFHLFWGVKILLAEISFDP